VGRPAFGLELSEQERVWDLVVFARGDRPRGAVPTLALLVVVELLLDARRDDAGVGTEAVSEREEAWTREATPVVPIGVDGDVVEDGEVARDVVQVVQGPRNLLTSLR
jgi:hypothetical protein